MNKLKLAVLLLVLILSQTGFVFADSIFDDSALVSTLKLTEKQIKKIENIEKEYFIKKGKLNADIILKRMQIAQVNNPLSEKTALLKSELRALENNFQEIDKDKEEEIVSALNFIQKFKYKRYIKKAK